MAEGEADSARRGCGWRLPSPRPAIAVGLLVAISIPVLFLGLGEYSVVNADEAFYHDVAWTMVETGDYWRVRTGPGEHVYDTFANAPLQYWARALVISWVGPGLFGMRIGSALTGLLAVLATWALVWRIAGRAAGFLAGLLLLTNFQFVYLHGARTGELDSGVALLLVLIAASFLAAIRRPDRSFLFHHACVALLFGWKAPVTPIPLLGELVCFVLLPEARARLGSWVRMGVLVAPWALGWHAWQAWRLHAVLPDVVAAVGDQAGRGGSFAARLVEHADYYARRIAFGAWPQIALLPVAIASLFSGAAGRTRDGGAGVRVIAIQLVAVIGFYCAIGKVGPWYVLHAYPFLAALIAIGVVDLERRRGVPIASLFWLAAGLALIGFVSPPLVGYAPFVESAIRIPMPVDARTIGGLPTGVAVALAAVALWSIGAGVARRRGSVRGVVAGATGVVVALSLLRVVAPLVDLRWTSEADALRAELDGRREAGQAIPYPIDVPPTHPWIAHYAFGHRYVMRDAPPRPDDPPLPRRRFVLVGERSGWGATTDVSPAARMGRERRTRSLDP